MILQRAAEREFRLLQALEHPGCCGPWNLPPTIWAGHPFPALPDAVLWIITLSRERAGSATISPDLMRRSQIRFGSPTRSISSTAP